MIFSGALPDLDPTPSPDLSPCEKRAQKILSLVSEKDLSMRSKYQNTGSKQGLDPIGILIVLLLSVHLSVKVIIQTLLLCTLQTEKVNSNLASILRLRRMTEKTLCIQYLRDSQAIRTAHVNVLNTTKPKGNDVTLVTQVSLERLDRFLKSTEFWSGRNYDPYSFKLVDCVYFVCLFLTLHNMKQ